MLSKLNSGAYYLRKKMLIVFVNMCVCVQSVGVCRVVYEIASVITSVFTLYRCNAFNSVNAKGAI